MSEIRSMPANDNYRKRWARVFNKKFVVVCGPGRSGTSLATKLVEACGFNLGECLPPNKEGSLRHGYGEHPLTNAQGEDIERAIDELEKQGANCVKLIHLYAQWIPRLKARGYDVRVVVTSRDEDEIWASGRDIYPGWKPQAIPAICGTANRILRETKKYLTDPDTKAFELPFHKVVDRDRKVLFGLIEFLTDRNGRKSSAAAMKNFHVFQWFKQIIRPDIVRHVK